MVLVSKMLWCTCFQSFIPIRRPKEPYLGKFCLPRPCKQYGPKTILRCLMDMKFCKCVKSMVLCTCLKLLLLIKHQNEGTWSHPGNFCIEGQCRQKSPREDCGSILQCLMGTKLWRCVKQVLIPLIASFCSHHTIWNSSETLP